MLLLMHMHSTVLSLIVINISAIGLLKDGSGQLPRASRSVS